MRFIVAATAGFVLIGISGAVGAADDSEPRANNPASALGVRPYRPNTWGIVAVDIVNPTQRDARMLVASSVGGAKTKQYGRLFWVPAGSRRRSWHPIFMPQARSPDAKSVDVESIVIDRTDSTEVLRKSRSGAVTHDAVLQFSTGMRPTGVIADLPDPDKPDPEVEAALDCVASCRFHQSFNRARLDIADRFLPPIDAAWDGLENLVLMGERIGSDSAALQSVRRWLQRGGRLWIMLDHVRPETVERLLGDACPYQEVDRVGLTRVKVNAVPGPGVSSDAQPHDHEQPVTLVRTFVSGVEVTHTVNGWPAAFRQRFGRGKVLYTALGSRGWVRRPGTGRNDKPFSSNGLRFVPRPPLQDLTLELYSASPSPLKTEVFEPYVSQQIGYEVVGFSTVLTVLSVFSGGLLLTGVCLVRVRRLDLLRWIGPAVAVVCAGALVFAGRQQRHAIPETVAVIQLAEVEPGSQDVSLSGLMAVYQRDPSEPAFRVSRGGLLVRSLAEREQPGTTQRMIWTDLDAWHWENRDVPSGVNLSSIRYSTAVRQPIRATGRFTADGLTGRLETGPFRHPADAVFATPARFNLAARLNADGTFTAGPGESLAAGEYIRGTLLTDEQRLRQDVYRRLLPNRARKTFNDRPTLLVWTDPIEMGLETSADVARRGSALLSIPLKLERTPPESRVTIPAAFLPYRRVQGPEGFSSSNHYSNKDGTWLERIPPARTWLRVQLPPEVTPLRIDRLTVTVLLSGKLQKLEIAGLVDGKPVTLATRPRPVGVQKIAIDDTTALIPDAQGGITIGLLVGDLKKKRNLNTTTLRGEKWNVEYLQVEIAGTTRKPETPGPP